MLNTNETCWKLKTLNAQFLLKPQGSAAVPKYKRRPLSYKFFFFRCFSVHARAFTYVSIYVCTCVCVLSPCLYVWQGKNVDVDHERSPAACGRLPEQRTGPVWCGSRRSGCTPDVERSPAWPTAWTAACPSLSPRSGTSPKPASERTHQQWEQEETLENVVSPAVVTPPGWGQCFGFLRMFFFFF